MKETYYFGLEDNKNMAGLVVTLNDDEAKLALQEIQYWQEKGETIYHIPRLVLLSCTSRGYMNESTRRIDFWKKEVWKTVQNKGFSKLRVWVQLFIEQKYICHFAVEYQQIPCKMDMYISRESYNQMVYPSYKRIYEERILVGPAELNIYNKTIADRIAENELYKRMTPMSCSIKILDEKILRHFCSRVKRTVGGFNKQYVTIKSMVILEPTTVTRLISLIKAGQCDVTEFINGYINTRSYSDIFESCLIIKSIKVYVSYHNYEFILRIKRDDNGRLLISNKDLTDCQEKLNGDFVSKDKGKELMKYYKTYDVFDYDVSQYDFCEQMSYANEDYKWVYDEQ